MNGNFDLPRTCRFCKFYLWTVNNTNLFYLETTNDANFSCLLQRCVQNPVKHRSTPPLLTKMVNGFKPLNIFQKCSNSDIWQGSEDAPGIYATDFSRF